MVAPPRAPEFAPSGSASVSTAGTSSKSGRLKAGKSTAKVLTGAIQLDEADDPTANGPGRVLVYDFDKNELGRIELPIEFRGGNNNKAAPFEPQLFKDYLNEKLGCKVNDVYYKLRDHKKGVIGVRVAKLGETDKEPKWPFVGGMRLFVDLEGGSGGTKLNKSPSTLWSAGSLSGGSTAESDGAGCSVM